MKVLLVQMNPTVGDLQGNTKKVLKGIEQGKAEGVDLVVFPELSLTGYPPDDFLLLPHFNEAVENHLKAVVGASKGIASIVGLPRKNLHTHEKPLFNSAAVIVDGVLIGFQDKGLLPTYDVFDERRYFEPAQRTQLWDIAGKKVAITLCEDLWQHSGLVEMTQYHRDPVLELKSLKPDLLINISASPYQHLKFQSRLIVCQEPAKTLKCPVLLCNQVGGNDSIIFDGYSLFVDEKGELCDYAVGFREDTLLVDLSKKGAKRVFEEDPIDNLYEALVLGVRDYFHKLNLKTACVGLSGGIDSAVVVSIAVAALGKENVLGVMMPSRFSSVSSLLDAREQAQNLGIESKEISIEGPFQSFLDLLEPHFNGKDFDATEENLQARIRGMILMALSNKFGYIVLSTGNKSEMAMGFATLYGDLCGGLGVLSDVRKQQVYQLGERINRERVIIPRNVFEKAPSAELRPNQKDSDTLPDYVIIDKVVQEYVEEHKSPQEIAKSNNFSLDLVEDLVVRIHRNEYKRRQSPPGLRVSAKAFAVGRRFPIVQKWTIL